MEEIVEKPASIADLERLEADIEEALISHIDKPADDSIIADLERRKLHLIARLNVYVVNTVRPVFIELPDECKLTACKAR